MRFQINGHTYIFKRWLPHVDVAEFYRESDPSFVQYRSTLELEKMGILGESEANG